MNTSKDINNLIAEEKLQVLDQVWESLISHGAEIPTPHWHEAVLENRLSGVESGELKFKSLDDVSSELLSETFTPEACLVHSDLTRDNKLK
ncbi:addiction module protein [Marinicella rhabdoformis]|uniref:addiction module protein n=1 Tax=Marinicella rhabdoformis TaxID=2580566 RepID=UPI0012AEB20B|nr:addiction module protein [Marinicella rhabdoformis]